MKYRKKPVVVEAMQFTDESKDRVFNFVGSQNGFASFDKNEHPALIIRTLEGEMTTNVGDWVIKGIKGEFYPCKPDIFEQTYEAVQESEI